MTVKRTVPIESVIVVVRGHRVIMAADLARIYGVETRVLNQAVKRNLEKFPGGFIFRLTRDEAETLSRSRSQSVILKRGQNIKFLPHAFTEHGALMAANVLNSPGLSCWPDRKLNKKNQTNQINQMNRPPVPLIPRRTLENIRDRS